MSERFKRAPSPTMAVALLALFVALGGTAVAAKVMITSSSQIRNGVVARADLRKGAVNSDKVANGSLAAADLSEGAKGSIQGAGSRAFEAYRKDGPEGVPGGTVEVVATLSGLPPGGYAIFAKSVLTAQNPSGFLGQGSSIGGHCVLEAEGDSDHARTLLGTPGANSPGGVTMQITRTFATTGTAKVSCDSSNAAFKATDTSIIALQVDNAPRQAVSGR